MPDTIVLDLETKKSFDEVGGKENLTALGVSVAGVYSYRDDAFRAYEEHEIPELEKHLVQTEHVIGFNLKNFDLPVLEPYLKNVSLARLAVTDIFEDAVKFLGHRIGLAGISKATLGQSKSGHGLEALEWLRQGKIEDVKKYCLDDVRLTRDLYEYGKRYGHILFESNYDRKIHSIPVNWSNELRPPVLKILEEALASRRRLVVEYISSEDAEGLGFAKERKLDVYKIKKDEIEAYCHLRKALRNFRINRIVRAEPTDETYSIPQDVQTSLF